MALPISPSALAGLLAKADAQGVPHLSPISRKADFSGGCLSPIEQEYCSREDPLLWFSRRFPENKLWRFHGGASHLNSHFHDKVTLAPLQYFTAVLPCRKCAVCLKRRARLWQFRAKHELAFSSRTWFATFTVNPEWRFRIDVHARRNADFSDDESFCARHAQISREFTLYFKRLRKLTRVPFRYLLVAEQHADGWPHYHALLHERGPMVTKRELQSQWKLGFTNFKLVATDDPRVAFYLTKYISKQALARIRASLRYGNGLFPSLAQAKRDNIDPEETSSSDCPF